MDMRAGSAGGISRRRFLRVSLEAAVASAGVYGVVEQLAEKPDRSGGSGIEFARADSALPLEQYLFSGTTTVTNNGVVVSVPPLYHEVVTAKLATAPTATALQGAQATLEDVLSELESEGLLTFTPDGLGIAVGWGLPYFQLPLLQSVASATLPLDRTAPPVGGQQQSALLPSIRFATDPVDVILEENDVAFVMASDSLANIASAHSAIFKGRARHLFEVTSIRKGFVDATQLGGSGQSLTKQFAVAHHLPGAASIPDQAQLFLGFTSTQSKALGPGTIANFETLGMTDQRRGSYFTYGTTLALSHLFEDLLAWYGNTYSQRVSVAFRPEIAQSTEPGTLTIDESAPEVETARQLGRDATQYGVVGHSASMQPVSRLRRATRGYAKGTAVPVRADFNTVDNPFAFSSNHKLDSWSQKPAAGLHFLTYVPTSFYFQSLRQAMDGPTGGPAAAPWERFVQAAGISTTHRQNFLIPPRAHRSFPLAELV